MARETQRLDDEEDLPAEQPRRPWMIGLPLSALGFGLAGYLTYEHYTSSSHIELPGRRGHRRLSQVTTSQCSKIQGIPVSLLGLIFFAVMIVLQSPPAWRSTSRAVRMSRVVWSLVGVGTALWLIYAELFKLGRGCLWCTSVHVVSLLLLGVTAFGTAATSPSYAELSENSA